MKRTTAVRVGLISAITAVLSVAPMTASAQTDQADVSEAPLAIVSGSPSTQAAAAPVCYGRSFVPYRAGKNSLSSAETECDRLVDRVVIVGNLQRGRWYGAQTLDNNRRESSFDFKVGTSLGWTCRGTGTYTYWTRSTHEAYSAGQPYSAATRSADRRFNC